MKRNKASNLEQKFLNGQLSAEQLGRALLNDNEFDRSRVRIVEDTKKVVGSKIKDNGRIYSC